VVIITAQLWHASCTGERCSRPTPHVETQGRDQETCLVSHKILSISPTVPTPGGQSSGMATKERLRLGQVGTVWASHRLPSKGLPRGSPGAERHNAHTGLVEGCPRTAAWSSFARPTGCHTAPVSKIVNDRGDRYVTRFVTGTLCHVVRPRGTGETVESPMRWSSGMSEYG
jgi:hypothetical protein